MKIDIVNNALPPKFDAIGHYTSVLSAELARLGHDVRVLVEANQTPDPIPGVAAQPAFTTNPPTGVQAILPLVAERRPDWLILNYNPFSYGQRGFNPYLPGVLFDIKKKSPQTRIALMAHESFVPRIDLKFWIMSLYQRPQFRKAGRASDVIFLSIEKWAREFQEWFPDTPVRHLPVPSNMPRVPISPADAKQRLGLAPDTPTLGLFGTTHASRVLDIIRRTMDAATAYRPDSRLIYVGPDRAAIAELVGDRGVFTDGPAPNDEVSRRFAAMDVSLTTFVDGVSTRRGSLMTALQHEVASLGTDGYNTDTIFRENADRGPILVPANNDDAFVAAAVRLLENAAERRRVAVHGRELYEANFSVEVIARRMAGYLEGM